MKNTVVKRLLEVTKYNLDLIQPKVIYSINEKFFLEKEQKEKDKFAIKFSEWLAENHYILFNIDKFHNKIWKDETHYFDTKMLLRKFKQENER